MKIILIGFMGVGKSVVGKSLANTINMKFIDMDNEIECTENDSINNIFEKHGEKYFRNIETNILRKLVNSNENIIISTGGGIVNQQENINMLIKEKKVIFLDANVETIKRNLHKEIDKRPLLKESKNINETIQKLLMKRYDKYNSVCDIKISVNDKNIQEVVSEILVSIG